MFDTDLELNIDQELSEMPSEYQDIFRQAIALELAETEQNRTDTDILTYLRQRRDDFKRGGFIRPDGRPGMVTLNPETMYEQALPELARSSMGEQDNTAEKRRTLIKIGVFVAVGLLFLFIIFRGRSQRAAEDELTGTGTPAAAGIADGTPTPTPPLPEIIGVDDSLQTIGSLGGALTIGRPSAIEISYGRTEETIALAIDPSKSTPKGELRFNEATMLSDNPVAVWLFGTVLNYAMASGIPDSMVRNLESGDRITLSTDTGASLRFVVVETRQGTNYEAGRLLSQNRLGMTLFALPATGEEDVSFALANYDIGSEENQVQAVYGIGDMVPLGSDSELQLSSVQISHTVDGDVRIVVDGATNDLSDNQSIMVSLVSSSAQSTAVQLEPDEDGIWQISFTLPDAVTEQPLFAEIRVLPSGQLAVVRLGDVPNLTAQLESEITQTWWNSTAEQAVMVVAIHNPGEGDVFLDPNFIQMPTEGGDAFEPTWQVMPRLPLTIEPGKTLGLRIAFPLNVLSTRVQIGADLWEVSAARPTTSPDQPISNGG